MGTTSFESQQILKLNLPILAKGVVEGFITGLHKSPFHGFSVEFAEHRLYNPGDSLRQVDWKLYGRTEKMFVKRFEEETNLRCQIVLDASSSMYFPQTELSKLTFAIQGAASLIELLARQKDASGISVFREKTELHTSIGSTPGHRKYLIEELEKLIQSPSIPRKTNLTDCLHQLAESLHRRSMIILFSDLFENMESPEKIVAALRHLKHNKHEVIVFHVYDLHKEANLDYENRPTRFIDLETGIETKLNPLEVRDAYTERFNIFTNEVQMRCAQNNIDYFKADISEGLYPLLRAWLIKRNKTVF